MKNHHHRRRRRHRVHTKLFLSLSERHFIPKCSLSLCPPQTLSLVYTYLLPIFVSVILVSVSYLHWILLCLIHTTYFSTYTFTFIPSLSHPPTYYPFHLYCNIFVFLSIVLSIYPVFIHFPIYLHSYLSVLLSNFSSNTCLHIDRQCMVLFNRSLSLSLSLSAIHFLPVYRLLGFLFSLEKIVFFGSKNQISASNWVPKLKYVKRIFD